MMAGPTIFVIDDQKSIRHALGEMLGGFGVTVETYESADSFLRAIGQPRGGCVVADVRMPGTDGIELVRELGRRKLFVPIMRRAGRSKREARWSGVRRFGIVSTGQSCS